MARRYEGKTNPKGVSDFGFGDDTSVEYAKDNNFYYIPGTQFKHPEWRDGYTPLGGDTPNLPESKLIEIPAKWTGNGSRSPQPDMNDWYETVRINYGVRPDGGLDFDILPNMPFLNYCIGSLL